MDEHLDRAVLGHRVTIVYPVDAVQYARHDEQEGECDPDIDQFHKEGKLSPLEFLEYDLYHDGGDEKSQPVKESLIEHEIIPVRCRPFGQF